MRYVNVPNKRRAQDDLVEGFIESVWVRTPGQAS